MADQGSIANLKQNIDENIVQNTTKQISGTKMNTVLNNIVDTLNFNGRDFFNVNEYNEQATAYSNAAAARADVPDEVKKLGLVITYLLSNGWYIDQFIGSNISGWETDSNWNVARVRDVAKILEGYLYRGVANPSDTPYCPVNRCWFLSVYPGQYTNFGNITIGAGLCILATADGGTTWDYINLSQNDNSFYGISLDTGGYIKIENNKLMFKNAYLYNRYTYGIRALTDGEHTVGQDNSIDLENNKLVVVSGNEFSTGPTARVQMINASSLVSEKINWIILGWYLGEQPMIDSSLLSDIKNFNFIQKNKIFEDSNKTFEDSSLFIYKAYLDKTTGQPISIANCGTTGFIPVQEGDIFFYKGWMSNDGCCVAGYDSSMAFTGILLQGTNIGDWYKDYVKIVIPNGVSYIRASGVYSYSDVDYPLSLVPLMGKALTDVYPYFEQFKGKKVLFFGDSYTELDQYTKEFERISGCVMYNRGVGGTTYGRITSQYYNNSLPNRCDMAANDSRTAKGSGLPTSVDAVFVLAGVNDWGRVAKTNGAEITENLEVTEPFGDWKVEDDTTFCGGCRYVLRKVKAKYPTAPIFVVLPVRAYSPVRYPSYNEFTYADANDEGSAITMVQTLADNKTFNDYREAIRHIALEYGLPVIDTSELGFSPAITAERNLYYNEGLHLNPKGMALLGQFIYKKAMTYLNMH